MSNPVAKVHERGKEPVDEDHAVLRAGANRTLPQPGSKPELVSLMPQRPNLGTSSAITTADRPVILQSLMIALRVAFPTTQP